MYAWGGSGAGGGMTRVWRLCRSVLRGLVRPPVSDIGAQGDRR